MIIAVDFDSTLHDGYWPSIGEPLPGAARAMQQLKKDGHFLIIWTCRDGGEPQQHMIEWLAEQQIPYDRINGDCQETIELYGNRSRKVYAHLYVDDKQVGKLPSWPVIYQYACKLEEEYLGIQKRILNLNGYVYRLGKTKEELLGKCRNSNLSDAREVYWRYLFLSGLSYSEIGRMFNRSHATIISGIRRVEALLDARDAKITGYYELLTNK